jgi:hypothetical protein
LDLLPVHFDAGNKVGDSIHLGFGVHV